MNWRRTSVALVMVVLVLGGFCTYLYEEDASLRLQQSGPIVRDLTPRIGIVVALPSEAVPVFAEFTLEKELIAYGFNFSAGKIANKPVVIVICGIGEESAASAVLAMTVLFDIE